MTAAFTPTAARPTRPARPSAAQLAWVTWRQHRTALLGILAVTALCALVLLLYGLSQHDDFAHYGMAACLPGHPAGSCGTATAAFTHDQTRITQLIAFVLGLPALFGLFLGASALAREYEGGTYRFAFTQGAGRTRWLAAKIILLSAFTVATTLGLTLVVMWWYSPLVPLTGRLGGSAVYEIYGPVFVARALFALALGICAGALLRRVVPTIALTLAVWTATVVLSVTRLRTHLMPAVRTVNGAVPDGSLTVSDRWAAPDGTTLGRTQVSDLEYRAAQQGHKLDLDTYLSRRGYRHTVTYQPGNRFWDLQAIEAGGLLVLSLLLLATAVWLVRRRAA